MRCWSLAILPLMMGIAVPAVSQAQCPVKKAAFAKKPIDPEPNRKWSEPLAATERRITILGTNDIHGGLEPVCRGKAPCMGGMAQLSGVIRAIRAGLAKREGNNVGTVVVDAGDQFQGTLVSNVNEGKLMLKAMSLVGRVGDKGGYDAIVPGNHDYDFGPRGWKVDEARNDAERRQALEDALGQLDAKRTAFVSANTFLLNSIAYPRAPGQKPSSVRCQPAPSSGNPEEASAAMLEIDFAKARRPDFVKPYVIKSVAGVSVALIGLDNPSTPKTTTARNVDDLCFSDELPAYRAIHDELIKAGVNVFVLVAHDGNSNNERGLETLIQEIQKAGLRIDAVVSGHTHFTYSERIAGVPVIQSGSGGKAFGRIDLIWDTAKKALVPEKSKLAGGIPLLLKQCDRDFKGAFCSDAKGQLAYEGEPVVPDQEIADLITKERDRITQEEPLAKSELGTVQGRLTRDRINESPLANAIADSFRNASGAEIAMVNTGGLRADISIDRGNAFFFEDLFSVLPFSNHGVLIEIDANTLEALLLKSIRTCGKYGALMQSGLMVTFSRDCSGIKPEDLNAQLLLVTKNDAARTVLFDAKNKKRPPEGTKFVVATFDFLAAGGSGYDPFKKGKIQKDLGILRDVLAAQFTGKAKAAWKQTIDNRWRQMGGAPCPVGPAAASSESVTND